MKTDFLIVEGNLEKVRRKLTDRNGIQQIRTVWYCHCKIGTHNGTYAYLFDKPEKGKSMDCVKLDVDPDVTKYLRAFSVIIDEVRDDNVVFCSKF